MNHFPYSLVDLTHTLDEHSPTWDGHCGFQSKITNDYGQTAPFVPFAFRVQQLTLRAGMGTHIDAPAHALPDTHTIDTLALSDLIAPCVVIDISEGIHERSSVTVDDVKAFEQRWGRITSGTIVLIRTGWDVYWNSQENYINNNVFPCVSALAAELLLERNIAALGVDTPSPDRQETRDYPVHALLFGAGKYIIENVTNLAALPQQGSYVLALPPKIKDAVEAPTRVVGLIPKK